MHGGCLYHEKDGRGLGMVGDEGVGRFLSQGYLLFVFACNDRLLHAFQSSSDQVQAHLLFDLLSATIWVRNRAKS